MANEAPMENVFSTWNKIKCFMSQRVSVGEKERVVHRKSATVCGSYQRVSTKLVIYQSCGQNKQFKYIFGESESSTPTVIRMKIKHFLFSSLTLLKFLEMINFLAKAECFHIWTSVSCHSFLVSSKYHPATKKFSYNFSTLLKM